MELDDRHNPHMNTLSPIYGFAAVRHQVRRMSWWHLGLFNRHMSLSNWYKIICIANLSCSVIDMKFTNIFSMYLQYGMARHFIEDLLRL